MFVPLYLDRGMPDLQTIVEHRAYVMEKGISRTAVGHDH